MKRIILFLVLVSLCLAPGLAAAESVTVAAGAGYKKMVSELAKTFTDESGIAVEQIFGNMGQTIAQAKNSGLVDCLIGDKRFLDKSGITFSAMPEIGRGKLVAVTPKGIALDSPMDIVNDSIKRVALPDPQKAIYGRAADEFLHNSGLYDKVQSKLLVVATLPQVSSYLLSNEVDVGFINMTDAIGIQDKVGATLPVDQQYYSPIIIVAGSLASAPNSEALAKFQAFLATEKAAAIARKHGL